MIAPLAIATLTACLPVAKPGNSIFSTVSLFYVTSALRVEFVRSCKTSFEIHSSRSSNMKSLIAVCLGLALASSSASTASAADNGISSGTLSSIGLSGFEPMSDAQAQTVRSKFVAVGGFGVAMNPSPQLVTNTPVYGPGFLVANGYSFTNVPSTHNAAGSFAIATPIYAPATGMPPGINILPAFALGSAIAIGH
jgi:hypothetical protein